MLAIGHDELGEYLGDTYLCERCGKEHKIEHGHVIEKDGTKTRSKLSFIKCGKKTFLVGIEERRIFNV